MQRVEIQSHKDEFAECGTSNTPPLGVFLWHHSISLMFKRLVPYLRRDGIGCSHWIARTYSIKKPDQPHEVDFMAEEEDDSFYDLSNEAPVHPAPTASAEAKPITAPNRPKLPTSIKVLNKALGRKQAYEIPEDELIEQFVRGELPGRGRIKKRARSRRSGHQQDQFLRLPDTHSHRDPGSIPTDAVQRAE